MARPKTSATPRVHLTNQDKVFYPAVGFTKGEMVEYYRAVAPHVLPHLSRRPVTLVRFPNGIEGKSFYEKNAPGFAPEWVPTFRVPRRRSGGTINYVLINNVSTLLWCANLAAIELHPFLHRAPAIDRPTSLAFDFDPGEGADVLTCIEVAFLVKEILDALGLQAFPKVTGSKGLQVHVPLNTAVSYAATGPFAKAVATLLEERHPDLVVSTMSKQLRKGRVMIDWSQNNASKTMVCVYSLRARRETPFVSAPVSWEELKRTKRRGRPDALYFEPKATLARLRKLGDLFAPVLTLKQKLPKRFDAPRMTRSTPGSPASRTGRTKDALRAYAHKRDFEKTAEPSPRARRSGTSKKNGDDGPRFVVQKHAARNLHYDFRLEMDGVLKSWAVPKGLPFALHVKRSGFEVEDHPIEYLAFEGTIPRGQYGGGTVMVWDIGTYDLLSGDPGRGSMRVKLHGRKLNGEWRLYRIRRERDKNVWLIEKSGRAAKPTSRRQEDASVLTRRSMARIAKDNDAQWTSGGAQ